MREKFKVFLKEQEQLTKADVKNEQEKEEYEQMEKFKEDEQKALKHFEIEVYKAKESKAEVSEKYKIPITLGSDAHKPEQVGSKFDETEKILANYSEIIFASIKQGILK